MTWSLFAVALGVMWASLAEHHAYLASLGIALSLITYKWLAVKVVRAQLYIWMEHHFPKEMARAQDELERRREKQREQDHRDRER